VTPPVRKTLNRLARTSWGEIQTRLSQEFSKRADYALYRTGLVPAAPQVLASPASSRYFFFSPEELPGRVALLKQHLPSAVDETIQQAEEILHHRFRVLGYRDLDYGAEIDWHLDAVHGKRAPLKPWYKVRFLDFDEVGDHKVTWELNRQQHLVTLAKAWAFTGNDLYIQEIARQFYSWQAANPYPMGINWGSTLEVAFRSLSWLWVSNLLARAPGLRESFARDVLQGLARNGSYIERFLSTYFSPNTHLIGEAVALFFIGTLCPEIASAQRWQQAGLAIVLEEAQRQVRSDGVYFEQSLYYHVYALDFFLHTRALASYNQVRVPESFDVILRKMLEVVRVLSGNGPPEGFGDDDGGRVFNPRRNRAEHMSDPLALGTALYHDQSIHNSTAPTEEAIWLFGEKAAPAAQCLGRANPVSAAFPDGGLYVMASRSAQMLIDAGPHGSGRGGHGHADALSVCLSMNGRPWLVDPGSYVYLAPEQQHHSRNQFRGTVAHNTLRVDDLDQAIAQGPFSWTSLPDVKTEEWIAAPAFDLFSGNHTGYARLSDPVIHRRMIFHLNGEYWLVRDVAEGKAEHDLEVSWHFAPGVEVSVSGRGLTSSHLDGESLILLCAARDRWHGQVEQGYVSPAYGAKQPAMVGRFRTRVQLPAEHATLLLPVCSEEQQGNFHLAETGDATVYTYEPAAVTDSFIFGRSGADWAFGPFRSDAKFLFARSRQGELELLFFAAASFVELNGQQVFRSQNALSWLQWMKAEGTIASDPQLLKFFDQEVLRNRTAVPLRQ
jgi:Heparinase II/III-like protein/Heparinase II/III N-terminus